MEMTARPMVRSDPHLQFTNTGFKMQLFESKVKEVVMTRKLLIALVAIVMTLSLVLPAASLAQANLTVHVTLQGVPLPNCQIVIRASWDDGENWSDVMNDWTNAAGNVFSGLQPEPDLWYVVLDSHCVDP